MGVPEKECFGLLGQSGAGKTTTFKMLTGETSVTEGNAYLKGYDVQSSLRSVRKLILSLSFINCSTKYLIFLMLKFCIVYHLFIKILQNIFT